MNIQFESIVIRNFKAIVGQPVTLKLPHIPGLHFLRGLNKIEPRLGSNGACKSSLWDALCWCLFARIPDGSRTPDIRPWESSARTRVTVFLNVDDKPYQIKRSTDPNRLTINGKDTDQEQVTRLLGLDIELFTHTILLGQGQPLFFDLNARDKLQLFSDVLQLDRWEARSKLAANRVADLERSEAVQQGELNRITTSQQQITEMLIGAKDKAVQWSEEQAERLQSYEKEIVVLQKQLDVNTNHLATADLAYDGAMTELKALQNNTANKEWEIVKDKLDRHHVKLSISAGVLTELLAELKTLKTADRCPTCGQTIKAVNLKEHKAELEEKIEAERAIQHAGVPKLMAKAKRLRARMIDSERYMKEFYEKADNARRDLDRLQPIVSEITTKIKNLKSNTREREDEQNPYQEQVQKLRRQKKQLQIDHDTLTADLKMLSRKIERTRFWVKGFKDVRLYIIDEVLQELELITNSTLDEIGLVNWKVKFDVERETKSGTTQRGLNVFIQSPRNSKPVRWQSWSGGEGQRLRLVGSLALSETLLNHAGVQTNLEILDEPTRHLSPEGVNDLCSFLAARAKQLNRQSWLIDHTAREGTHFTRILTVTRTKDQIRLIRS